MKREFHYFYNFITKSYKKKYTIFAKDKITD